MSENITLLELLDLSIGTPHRGSVNFSALYALLLAVLKQLGILETKTRWPVPSPGHTEPDASVKVTARDRRPEEVRVDTEGDQQVQSGCEPPRGQDFGGSPRPDSGSAPDREGELGSRIQVCEDGVSKGMELIKELMEQKDVMKEKMEKLHQQQETAGTAAEVDRCCHRVDALEEALSRLGETLHKHPGPEELSQRVTPDSVRSVLNNPKDTTHQNLSQKVGGSAWDQEIMEAVRNINNLQEKLIQLEARTVALEEQKLDQNQLAQLRELITNKGSQDSSLMDQLNQQRDLIQSLMSDRKKLDNLEDIVMDLKSLDRESSTEATSESLDTDSNGLHVLRQQMSHLRKSQDKLEEDVTHVRSKQALMEERAADQNLQDQLDDLRDKLEGTLLSLTSQLSSSVQDEAEQDKSESQGVSESAEGPALTSRTENVDRKLSLLFQHYEQLQDTVNALIQQQSGAGTGPLEDRQASRVSTAVRQNVALVNDMQKVIPQLQAECEKLQVTSRNLHEDNRLKQRHIEELYRTTKELQEKKADRHMVESEIKADKSALENKVSRLQFDSATEQLSSMFHELLNKVTGQEQDWRQVMDRLSTEMECKLNRMELDSVKKQLEDRWKSIHEKLQAQSAPEHEDAAGLRKQLMERFHCLSCDRPILKQTPGPLLVTLPSFPAFPSHKSTKPYGVEQLRQQSRSLKAGTNRYNFWMANEARKRAELQKSYSNMCRQMESVELQRQLENEQNPAGVQHKRISEPTDYPVVPRSCGGSRTNTWTGQRRSGPQHTKLLPQSEADGVSQEFDIIGFDGRIYKGRLNVQALRNTETKLPTIPSKDGMCRTKDKARSSASQRPAASPDVGHNTLVHPPSAKSNSCPASSCCSGRDWPVSALGCCTSQSSVSQASAAAGSSLDPHSDDQMNM